jgi:hypothetical protein
VTEGTPAVYATVEDVEGRWRPLTDDEKIRATTRLTDASALLRRAVPGIDQRLAGDPDLRLAVTSRVADVVIRFLQNPAGAKQLQETIGPRSYGLTFDGKPVGIFFTDEDLAALLPSAGMDTSATAMGTAFVAIRPGWGPLTAGCGWPQL